MNGVIVIHDVECDDHRDDRHQDGLRWAKVLF